MTPSVQDSFALPEHLGDLAAQLSQATGHARADMEPAVLAFVGQLVRRNAAALVAPQE